MKLQPAELVQWQGENGEWCRGRMFKRRVCDGGLELRITYTGGSRLEYCANEHMLVQHSNSTTLEFVPYSKLKVMPEVHPED